MWCWENTLSLRIDEPVGNITDVRLHHFHHLLWLLHVLKITWIQSSIRPTWSETLNMFSAEELSAKFGNFSSRLTGSLSGWPGSDIRSNYTWRTLIPDTTGGHRGDYPPTSPPNHTVTTWTASVRHEEATTRLRDCFTLTATPNFHNWYL